MKVTEYRQAKGSEKADVTIRKILCERPLKSDRTLTIKVHPRFKRALDKKAPKKPGYRYIIMGAYKITPIILSQPQIEAIQLLYPGVYKIDRFVNRMLTLEATFTYNSVSYYEYKWGNNIVQIRTHAHTYFHEEVCTIIYCNY